MTFATLPYRATYNSAPQNTAPHSILDDASGLDVGAIAGRKSLLSGLVGDAIDFDQHIRGMKLRFDRGTGGAVIGEELRVDFVHLLELSGILQEDRALHYIVEARPAEFQDRANIRERDARLVAHIARRQAIGYRVDGPLAAHVDKIPRADRR
jgi:hypothetical protein